MSPRILLDLLVALSIDAARHLGRLELGALLRVLGLETADARTRRQRAAHRIDDAITGVVAAQLERAVEARRSPKSTSKASSTARRFGA
jgi:hypothetical protein